jgi:hypothetical protein
MSNYFPRQTVIWKLQETPGFRRLTLSLLEMALVTGVLLRVYRAFVLANTPGDEWLYLGGSIAFGVLFLCAMATLHLGNYPVRHWVWRAPAFAGLVAAAEMAVSAILIALHREPYGSGRAVFTDWPGLAAMTMVMRFLVVCSFALVLAGVVQVVRRVLLAREHRAHGADAASRPTGEHGAG